jgi:hypothetical protein
MDGGPKKRSRVQQTNLPDHSQLNGLLRRDNWDEASAADPTPIAQGLGACLFSRYAG